MSGSRRMFNRVLVWLIEGTRGGPTRAEIIKALKENPQNANQLANELGMDYRTIRHHLDVLLKNKVVVSVGDRYGVSYFLTEEMEESYPAFEEILDRIWKREKKRVDE